MTRKVVKLIALVTLASPGLSAVQDASQEIGPPRFDVVSVVVDLSGTGGAGDDFPRNGAWRWTRIPLSFLVRYAYDVSLQQIAGVPDSFQGPHTAFDIVAKMPANTTRDRFRLMLQSLLADRFKAVIHRETRDVSVNTIEVAKGGGRLQPATDQCVQGSGTVPPEQHRCGQIEQHIQVQDQEMTHEYIGRSVSVADLAWALAGDTPLVDDTGIKGLYDIDVTVRTSLPPPSDDPAERSERESTYQYAFRAAFEKQLGLTIDRTKFKKRPVPVIVVDHVEMPTPN